MNGAEIEKYMLTDPFIRQIYGGVIAKDQLPFVVKRPSIYIVNTDPMALPGEHWVALYFDERNEHFDSAGFQPRPYFETYLNSKGSKYMYNDKRVQNFSTNSCGKFALMYCYFRARNYSFSDIISMFSDNLILNEIIVHTFYELSK